MEFQFEVVPLTFLGVQTECGANIRCVTIAYKSMEKEQAEDGICKFAKGFNLMYFFHILS